MKKVLIVLFLIPVFCSAQTFEVGAAGGFQFHSLPLNNPIAKQDRSSLGLAGGAKIDLLLPHSQIGIGVSMTQITETNYLAPNYTMRVRNYVAHPLITPYGFYNRVWDQGNVYPYAGGMAGLAIAGVGVNSFDYQGNVVTGYSTTYNTVFGFVAGLQAGFVSRLSKKLGLGVEAAMRYTSFTYTPPAGGGNDQYRYRLFYFPITISLRYFI